MADAMAPNFLTVDAAGHIGAQFTGKLEAQGIDFPAGLLPENMIRWLTEGIPQLTIDGAITPGSLGTHVAQLLLAANLEGKQDTGSIGLEAKSKAGADLAELTVQAESGYAALTAQVDAVIATLINSLGESSFPRLAAAGKHIQGGGQVQVKWGLKGVPSFNTKVLHGLGDIPRLVTATGLGFNSCYAEVSNLTKESFLVRLVSTSGEVAAGTERTVNWYAET